MKRLIVGGGLLLLASLALGQAEQQETLFRNARFVGGFGAPFFEFGLGSEPRHSAGVGGGVVVDDFFFGGYGMAGLDLGELIDDPDQVEQLDIAHGGLWFGYTYASNKIVHPYASMRLGWGAVNIQFDDPNQTYESVDKIFVFTPELGAEINLTRWWRLVGTAGYRVVSGVDEETGFRNSDFRGWTAAVTMRFGSFSRGY